MSTKTEENEKEHKHQESTFISKFISSLSTVLTLNCFFSADLCAALCCLYHWGSGNWCGRSFVEHFHLLQRGFISGRRSDAPKPCLIRMDSCWLKEDLGLIHQTEITGVSLNTAWCHGAWPASVMASHICMSSMLWALLYVYTVTGNGFCIFHWWQPGWPSPALACGAQHLRFPKTSWNINSSVHRCDVHCPRDRDELVLVEPIHGLLLVQYSFRLYLRIWWLTRFRKNSFPKCSQSPCGYISQGGMTACHAAT